jgi:hypothetical protein
LVSLRCIDPHPIGERALRSEDDQFAFCDAAADLRLLVVPTKRSSTTPSKLGG